MKATQYLRELGYSTTKSAKRGRWLISKPGRTAFVATLVGSALICTSLNGEHMGSLTAAIIKTERN